LNKSPGDSSVRPVRDPGGFPSTSEVYGMCPDAVFNESTSNLVYGPIHKQRWIYACAKQLLDRVIWAMGLHSDLRFTLIRPFNWIGPVWTAWRPPRKEAPGW